MLDPKLTHAFISQAANDADAAGEYDAVLLDNSSHGGPDLTYRLTIRKKQPQFRIGVASNRVHARKDSAAKLPVSISREEGFDGDVPVTVRGLPAGWSAKPLTIAKGSDSGDLEIWREDSSPAQASFEVLSGTQIAAVPPFLGEDGLGYLEAARTQVGVSFVDAPLFTLRPEEAPKGYIADLVSTAPLEIPVVIERSQGFEGPITLGIDDLPAGAMVKSQDDSHVWIQIDPAVAKAGTYRIALRGLTSYQGKERVEVSTGFRLQVK